METVTKLIMVPVGQLRPYANNARQHSQQQIEQLRASMRAFGFVAPILIDRDYNVIAGHGRLTAGIAENIGEIPCVLVEHLLNATRSRPIITTGTFAARPTSVTFPTLYLSTDKAAGNADRLTLNMGGSTWLQI